LSNLSKPVTQSTTTNNIATTATNKPSYYKKSCYATQQQQPKPKMSNSLEFLAGPIADIQKKYEILSDSVIEIMFFKQKSFLLIKNLFSMSYIYRT
jgi:hypothetical protein